VIQKQLFKLILLYKTIKFEWYIFNIAGTNPSLNQAQFIHILTMRYDNYGPDKKGAWV